MNPKEHRKDFNRRWDIPSISDSPQEAFSKFKQRILNIFVEMIPRIFGPTIDNIITLESELEFCQDYSIPPKISYNQKITIIDRLRNEKIEKEFYRLIEIILSLNIADQYDDYNGSRKRFLVKQIKKSIEMSDVDVAITENPQGKIILYPKGEKKLDEELVNQTLKFLNPESNKHFEEALKLYQKNNPIKSAESLRRCLEEFLRYKLENKIGLAGNIKLLQKQLKENKGKDKSEIKNIIFQIFDYLDKYFNKNSKHQDGDIDETENEFLIYQTGLLMRYINSSLGDKP